MKTTERLLLFLLLCLGAAALIQASVNPPPAPPGFASVAWDYPASLVDTGTTFFVHQSADVATPLASWPVATQVVGQTFALISTNAARAFFFVTVSNGFSLNYTNRLGIVGESDPSEVRAYPPLPVSNLRFVH
jgi:hypothetical protein